MSSVSTHRSRSGKRTAPVVPGGAWGRFKRDLRDVRERYIKRTSKAHMRFVLALILGGAALRVWAALQPITGQEAIAFMTFGAKPFGEVISNYALPINHVFHTLLSKWSVALFGNNVIALRLPALLAGVLALPFYYLFVRAMFNRYIALMALAMAAASPCLIEVSALAHGYSITWLCLMVALCAGRHFVKEYNVISVIIMAVACAFGMWAVPSMLVIALAVFLWAMFAVLTKYERSVGERMPVLGLGFLVFLVLSIVLYFPVILEHGIDQLFHHATDEQYSWKTFSLSYPDRVFDIWLWFVQPTYWWVALLGFIALTHAAYISGKFRSILFAMCFGAIPLTLLLADVGDTYQWSYLLFMFHLGTAIAVFYLLKFIQDKMAKNFGKRSRTAGAAVVLFLGFALPGMSVVLHRVDHLGEAKACADYLVEAMRPNDRLCLDGPWETSVGFYLRSHDMSVQHLLGTPPPGGLQFIVVAQPQGQPLDVVLARCGEHMDGYGPAQKMKEWARMDIFAAPLR